MNMSFEEKDRIDQLHHEIALCAEQAVYMAGLVLDDYFEVINPKDKAGQRKALYEFPRARVFCRVLDDLVKRIKRAASELPGNAVNIEDMNA